MINIAAILERLCAHCDEEAERQETVLQVCRAQLCAARAHDIEQLEAKTAALLLLIQETVEAEKTRIALLHDVVGHYQLSKEKQTLTELIVVAPEPWSSRLREFQTRLRSALEETRRVTRENRMVVRRSLNVLNRAMEAAFKTADGARGVYDARGEQRRGAAEQPTVLDRRG